METRDNEKKNKYNGLDPLFVLQEHNPRPFRNKVESLRNINSYKDRKEVKRNDHYHQRHETDYWHIGRIESIGHTVRPF